MLKDLTLPEQDSIRIFTVRAQELRDRRLIKNGIPAFSIKAHLSKESLEYTEDFPDEEDFRSLLVAVRTFILNNEPNSFNRVCNLLFKKIEDEELKKFIIEVRKVFKDALEKPYIAINFNGKDFKPEDIVHYWLNAHYFHSDIEKEKVFKQMELMFPILK